MAWIGSVKLISVSTLWGKGRLYICRRFDWKERRTRCTRAASGGASATFGVHSGPPILCVKALFPHGRELSTFGHKHDDKGDAGAGEQAAGRTRVLKIKQGVCTNRQGDRDRAERNDLLLASPPKKERMWHYYDIKNCTEGQKLSNK